VAILASHRFIGGVEHVFFELGVYLQCRKDLLGNHLLGAAIPCTRILSKEVMNEPVIGFQHGNGINRLCIERWGVVVLTRWHSSILCPQVYD
jgi:hypothetical protein